MKKKETDKLQQSLKLKAESIFTEGLIKKTVLQDDYFAKIVVANRFRNHESTRK